MHVRLANGRTLRAGANVVQVSELLGHSSSVTPQRYVDDMGLAELRADAIPAGGRLTVCLKVGVGAAKSIITCMGRPSLLTPERSAAILDMIRSGALIKTACKANGISESTLHYWVSRADDPEADPTYSEFSEALTRARALAEVDAVKLIVEADHKHWRAAAWFLERSFPEHYGNRRRLEHVGGEGGPITLAGLAELMGMDDERATVEV